MVDVERESLYPKLESFDNVSERYNKNLSDARIKEIQGKRHEMEKSLKHYEKILKRWKLIENIVKCSSLTIVVGCGVVTTLGFGGLVTPLIITIVSVCGASEGIMSQVIVEGVVNRRIVKFKKSIQHIKEYISKSWYLFEKIRSDGVISLQELDEFRVLMEKYEQGLTAVDSVNADKEYVKLRDSLRHKVEKEARKEVKQELMNDLKNELKQKMLQKQE